MTKAMIPVVALTAGLSANATLACCTEADPADAREAAMAYEREAQAPREAGPGPAPPGDPWRSASAAEDEARALAAREAGTPAANGVQRLALSALAEHAARAMGAESARVLGLDAIAPPIAVGEPPRLAPASTDGKPSVQPGAARRMDVATGRLTGGPRPVALVATPYDGLIEEAASQHAVSPDLVRAVVKVESNFQPHARSPKGAIGLMQVMPATGRRFGAVDLHDPRTNIQAGTRYLRWLLTRYGEDMTLALAAYNAGEGAVEKHGRQIPPYAETRDYVGKVLRHLSGSDAATAVRSTSAANGPGGSAGDARVAPALQASAPASSEPIAHPPRANGALQTVATWMGALLTSAYRPRSATLPAAGETVAAAPVHGAGMRVADAFSAGPR